YWCRRGRPGAAARQIMMPPTAIRVNSTSASGARAEGLPVTLKLLTWPDDLSAPAEFVVQPGAAHIPWLDDPKFFVRTVGEFLSRSDA
ncbi:hypothetical protein ABZ355_43850, partial [Streptomyces sp. NPDC005989]